MVKRGTAYGVGIGPGDPELMSLKAVRLIRENEIIAVPGKEARQSVAYQIAVQAVPELKEKELVPIYMPMVRDRAQIEKQHRKGAEVLEHFLDQGRNVVYLILGDPMVYSTFSYLQHILEKDAYPVELVSGIPSFCAAAARLHLPLAEWDEPLHVIPAVYRTGMPAEKAAGAEDDAEDRAEKADKAKKAEQADKAEKIGKTEKAGQAGEAGNRKTMMDAELAECGKGGTYVLMKSASHIKETKALLQRSGREAQAVINCGMADEKICRNLAEIPDDAGYFTLIIAKEKP